MSPPFTTIISLQRLSSLLLRWCPFESGLEEKYFCTEFEYPRFQNLSSFGAERGAGRRETPGTKLEIKILFQVGLHAPRPSSTGTTFLTQRWRRELMALRLVTTLSTSTSAVSAELVLLVSTPSLSLEVSWMSPSKIFLNFFSAWSSGNKSRKVMISLFSLIRNYFYFSCFYLFRSRGRVVRVLDLSFGGPSSSLPWPPAGFVLNSPKIKYSATLVK